MDGNYQHAHVINIRYKKKIIKKTPQNYFLYCEILISVPKIFNINQKSNFVQ